MKQSCAMFKSIALVALYLGSGSPLISQDPTDRAIKAAFDTVPRFKQLGVINISALKKSAKLSDAQVNAIRSLFTGKQTVFADSNNVAEFFPESSGRGELLSMSSFERKGDEVFIEIAATAIKGCGFENYLIKVRIRNNRAAVVERRNGETGSCVSKNPGNL